MNIRINWVQAAAFLVSIFVWVVIYSVLLFYVDNPNPLAISTLLYIAIVFSIMIFAWNTVFDFLAVLKQVISPKGWFLIRYALWFLVPFVFFLMFLSIVKIAESSAMTKFEFIFSASVGLIFFTVIMVWHSVRAILRQLISLTPLPANRAHIYSLPFLFALTATGFFIFSDLRSIILYPLSYLDSARHLLLTVGGLTFAISLGCILVWEILQYFMHRVRGRDYRPALEHDRRPPLLEKKRH